MKHKTQRNLLLGVFALGLSGFVAQAQARTDFDIQVNVPVPETRTTTVERWESPGYGAVWVRPHYEWVDGQWVWYDGYYEYPPRPGAVFVESRYYRKHGHHYWTRSHWR